MRRLMCISVLGLMTTLAFMHTGMAALSEPDTNTMVPVASASASTSASEGPKMQHGCDPEKVCAISWTRRISIGPGMTAVSFRFDGNIGLADKIVPLEVSYNAVQRTFPQFQSDGHYADPIRVIFWRLALGITASKPADGTDVVFGAYFQPWGIQVDRFAAGVGIAYQTIGKVEGGNAKWSIVIPFSYSVSL